MIVSPIILIGALLLISLAQLPTLGSGTRTRETRAPNTITGFVYGPSGRPVADVYVELLTDSGSNVSRTKTHSSGNYSFRGLSDGVFTVRVLGFIVGYADAEQRVSLQSFSMIPGRGSVTEQVDFHLKAGRSSGGPLGDPGVVFAQDVPAKARKLYEAGVEDLANKKDAEGFEKLRAAIDAFPTYYLALDRLGTEYVVRGHYQAAHVLLRVSLHVNPRSFSSRFGLGIAQFKLGDMDEAIGTLRTATETYGESANAYMWLGIALHKKGNLAEAKDALLRANRLSNSKSADVHWNLAQVYKDQGLFVEAADALERVLKIKPDHESAAEIRKAIQTLRSKANGK